MTISRLRGVLIPMLLPSLATALLGRAEDATDRLSRVVPITAATPIRIDATIADLTIVGSDRSDALVDIVRRAPSSAELSKFPATIDARADGVHVSVVQAGDGRDARLRSTITVAAPANAVIQTVRVFEGRVRIVNVKAACDVDLRRGPIDGEGLAGRIRLESGIGSVDVRDSELTPGGMMRLRVFNGTVRVRFAHAPANGRILALTFNGAITSDIPLTKKDRFGPRFGETTLGSGDPVLSMDVVKGDIALSVSQR